MQLQLQEPQQQHKLLLELIRSRQSVQQEERQIGQLVAEVIKLRKEAEVARLEVLALDKELQINQLLDKLVLDRSEDQDPPLLVETFQEGPNQSRQPNQHQQHHNQSRRPRQHQQHHNQSKCPNNLRHPRRNLPLPREVPQGANHRRDHRQQGHQEDNHLHHHQEGRQAANHKQLHRNKPLRRPMGPMGL